jgi:hypothetical protein
LIPPSTNRQVLQYNPPTTLPFLRRNEISIRLRTTSDDADYEGEAAVAEEDGQFEVESVVEEEYLGTDEENGMPSD